MVHHFISLLVSSLIDDFYQTNFVKQYDTYNKINTIKQVCKIVIL